MEMPMGNVRHVTEMTFLALLVLAAMIRQKSRKSTRRKESRTWEIVFPVTLKGIKGMIRDVEKIFTL
jgi:hypothetical protein